MVENEVSINGRFSMKINFNLKGIGGKKSQIWLTTTINKERVRAYTGLLIEPEFWIKTTRTQVGERASEDSALGRVQLNYNKGVNKGLKKILGYCHEYGIQVSQSHLMNNGLEHNAKNFSSFINGKIRGVEATIRKNPVDFINAYIERKSQMVNKDTQRKIVSGTIYNHRNALQRLQKFCEDKHIRLVWEVFNAQLEERFTAWMMSKNYTANTIASQYSIMKVWLSEAEIEGLITDKSFHRYTTKCHDVENIYLTEEDINKLYAIDFNSCKLRENIREKARAKGENMTDGEVLAALNEKIDTFKSKMPFTISLERDSEDIEKLSVESVEDSNGNEFSRDYFEVDIQSLGINYNYWLDTGSFDF